MSERPAIADEQGKPDDVAGVSDLDSEDVDAIKASQQDEETSPVDDPDVS